MLILLKQRYIAQVLAGTKTSTIRLWPRCHLRPGDPVSFNGSVRATCVAVERVRLTDLTDGDIRADGFMTRAEFLAAFHAIYPLATDDTLIWIIRFALKDSSQSARAVATSGQLFPT